MNQPQGEASATIEPEPRLPNLTTEDGTHDDAPSADNVTLQDQQPHPLPPNPFLTQPTAETEQHTAIPDRDVNATPPPTAIGAVSVTVRDSHGGEVTFKIKKHTKLNKLMKAFCERQAKTPSQVRFFFDGTRITGDDTPESVRVFPSISPICRKLKSEEALPTETKLFLLF